MSVNSTTHIPPEKAFHINVLTELTTSRLQTHAATKHTKRQDTYTPTTHRSKIQSDNSDSTTVKQCTPIFSSCFRLFEKVDST